MWLTNKPTALLRVAAICIAAYPFSLTAQAAPLARVDVAEFLTPTTGSELRQDASAETSSGTVSRGVSTQDTTFRAAEATATTGTVGSVGAYGQVGVPNQPGGPGEPGDIHRSEATSTYVIEWEVESATLPVGTLVADTVIDLAIDGAFSLDFRPDQQPNYAFGFWNFGDEASFEDTLISQETMSLEVSTLGIAPAQDVILSFEVGMDDSGDIILSDEAFALGLGFAFDDSLSVLRTDGTATYTQTIDEVISVSLGGDVRVGDRFELSVTLGVIAEMIGVTAFSNNGERYVATATADFLNSASYTLRNDTADVSFVSVPIPEPTTSILLGLGLLGMALRRPS